MSQSTMTHEEAVTFRKELQDAVVKGEHLEKLEKNKDFQKLILKNYFQDHAVRLVHLLGDPNVYMVEDRKKQCESDINAIGKLAEYFRFVKQKASEAAINLQKLDEAIADFERGE